MILTNYNFEWLNSVPKKWHLDKVKNHFYISDIRTKDFNNYLTRRANHEIVARSTFASLRLRNLMTPDQEGSVTVKYPENKVPLFKL